MSQSCARAAHCQVLALGNREESFLSAAVKIGWKHHVFLCPQSGGGARQQGPCRGSGLCATSKV